MKLRESQDEALMPQESGVSVHLVYEGEKDSTMSMGGRYHMESIVCCHNSSQIRRELTDQDYYNTLSISIKTISSENGKRYERQPALISSLGLS